MGDLQVWLPHPNGVLTSEEAPSPSSLPCPSPSPSALPTTSNPNPSSISSESWCRAERTTHEIICRIQPTVVSEQRRKAVVDYVQRLIGGYLGSEVFPFGSVPLKTYLPDGDIDLTALSYQNVEDALAHDVRSVLEGEEQNKDAEFEVKDVQYIHAEVKLIKCLVQNIVVDISFNQLGGLCALCFLEQVDRLIGKGHLFKRSIILIKAWCYYESRILGAHHGLISTYALETLVLYIFHLFHSSLDGPLAVLYRFLDYFSKFDWDYHGISLSGPVVVSSLPEIVVQMPETDGHDFLLKKDFLKNCVDMFSVPSRGVENNMRSFPPKHLNIVDPLKENNNLGRSVSKGNFYRIRSAFSYGARKLGRILLLPGESMEDELNKFFLNTLERHGSGQRPDVQDFYNHQDSSMLAVNDSCVSLRPHLEKCAESTTFSGLLSVGSTGKVQKITNDCQEALSEKINSIDISGSEKEHGKEIHWERPSGNKLNGTSSSSITIFSSNKLNGHEPQKCASSGHFSKKLGPNCSLEGDIVSGTRLAGDAKDLATSQSSSLTCKSPSSSNSHGAVSFARPFHTPHLYFFRPFQETEKLGNRDLEQMNSTIPENRPQALDEQQDHGKSACNDALQSCGENMSPASVSLTDGFPVVCLDAYPSEIPYHANDSLNFLELSGVTTSSVDFRERFTQCASGNNPVSSKSLSDLSGDYDSHFNSLRYGQWYHEYFLCGPVLPFPLQSPQYYNKSSWDALCRSAHLKQGMFSHVNANGVPGSGPVFPTASGYYPVNPPIVPGAFGVEEMPKKRGTGTYFPNTNHRSYSERPPGRGRNLASALHNQMPRPRNGRIVIQSDTMSLPVGLHELPQVHTVQQLQPFGVNGRAKPSPSDFTPASHTVARIIPHANGCVLPTESLEFGSFGPVLLVGDTSSEPGRQVDSSSLLHTPHCSGSTLPVAAIARSERIPQSYRLKDEDDFPPLSV